MAIVLMEGFDQFPTSILSSSSILSDVYGYYTGVYNDNLWIADSTPRFSTGKYLRIYNRGDMYFGMGIPSGTITDTIYASFAVYAEAVGNTFYTDLIKFISFDGTSYNCAVRWGIGGTIQIMNPSGGTAYTSGAGILDINKWHWIDIKVYMHDSAGYVEVWVDGTKEVDSTDYTGDTKRDTTASVTSVRFTGSNTGGIGMLYDDVVVQDDAGAILGDSKIETFMPSGDNSVTWSQTGAGTNAADVAVTTSTIDTDYVYSSTVDQVDLYDVGALSTDGTVYAVGIQYRALKTKTGAREIQGRTKSSTNERGGTVRPLGISYQGYDDIFEWSNDAEDVAWTKTLFDAAQFGIKVTT